MSTTPFLLSAVLRVYLEEVVHILYNTSTLLLWQLSQRLLAPENKSLLVGTMLLILAAIECFQAGLDCVVRTVQYVLDIVQMAIFIFSVCILGVLLVEALGELGKGEVV